MQKDSKFKAWLNLAEAWPGQLSETLCQTKKKKNEAGNVAQW